MGRRGRVPGVGIAKVAKQVGLEPLQAYSLFQAILTAVKSGDRVYVKDFGSFFQSYRKAYTVHVSILPGGKASVPERMVLRFRPSATTRAKPDKRKRKVP